MMTSPPELLYIADPLCSWCWGFAPVLDRLRDAFLPALDFRLIMGGLRPGPAAKLVDAAMKAQLREHWQAVQALTQQPFAWEFFDRNGFLYDTEPPAKAVVAVRRLNPALEYAYFRAVQTAFYAHNEDVTQPQTLAALATAEGLAEAVFLRCYADAATAALTQEDFQFSRQLGVQGFPTLLLRLDAGLYPITQGYQPYARLEPVLRGLLAR